MSFAQVVHSAHNANRPVRRSAPKPVPYPICDTPADNTLVWMYQQLSTADQRRFFQLDTPGERFSLLMECGERMLK